RARARPRARGGLRHPAARLLPWPLVVPGRLVPAPRGAPGAARGDALGRDGSARAGRGEGAGGASPPAHPPPQLRRHLGPPAQPEQADGRGRRAAAPPATGRRLAPDRGARMALRARLSRAGWGARGVPRALRGRDRRVLRLPPLGQGARAARARGRGPGLTPPRARPYGIGPRLTASSSWSLPVRRTGSDRTSLFPWPCLPPPCSGLPSTPRT